MKKLLAICMFWATASQAIVLEELIQNGTLETTFQHKKIGYFLGSFDPLHKGHEAFVESFISQGFGDLVIVYPSWGGDTYKSRTDVNIRLDMLFAVYKDHPKVIVTRLIPKNLQTVLTIPSTQKIGNTTVCKPAFEGVQFIGMLGSDVVGYLAPNKETSVAYMTGTEIPEEFHAHTFGSCMALPVNEFVVALRKEDDRDAIGSHLHGRKIHAIISVEEWDSLSSTAVKQALSKKKSIDLLISRTVREIIEQHSLYTPSSA